MAKVEFEVILPDNLETDPTRYRREFLRALRDSTPEVLETLRNEVLPAYSGPSLFWSVSMRLGFAKGGARPAKSELGVFKSTMESWAARFNLRDHWLSEVAVLTLDRWKKSNGELAMLDWADFPFAPAPLPLEGREIEFHDAGWQVEGEEWRQFSARINKAFKSRLAEYKQAIERQVVALNLQMPPRIREPEHYDWLALYQVEGLSARTIADLLHTDTKPLNESAVLKAVTKTAELIRITLRTPRKGSGKKLHPKTIGRPRSRRP